MHMHDLIAYNKLRPSSFNFDLYLLLFIMVAKQIHYQQSLFVVPTVYGNFGMTMDGWIEDFTMIRNGK